MPDLVHRDFTAEAPYTKLMGDVTEVRTCEYLISSRVVRPGVVHLLVHVATARTRAREETWTRVGRC